MIIACLKYFVRRNNANWVQEGNLKAVVESSVDGSKETACVKEACGLEHESWWKGAF